MKEVRRLDVLGQSRETFYFESHGEINTDKTIELARRRADVTEIEKIVVASETGLSALKAVDVFEDFTVIVVSSAAGTMVKGSSIGDLRIGIPDEKILGELEEEGAKVVRGTDPFWNLGAHSKLIDTGKTGMMFYKVVCSGFHVCMTAVLEATDAGYVTQGEEVVALSGSFVGLDTAIVALSANSVNFFNDFEVLELVCKPRRAVYTWPINQVDWKGDIEKYKQFTI
ncbi:hypothetical protein GF326_08445 [Candidatus Bathyarchaeota archaeon]|nr:hypothetical protein [Candidatus Bathyarchaeota archaeon]